MNISESWTDNLWEKSIGLRAIFYLVPPSQGLTTSFILNSKISKIKTHIKREC